MKGKYEIWIDEYEDYVVVEYFQKQYRPVVGYPTLTEALEDYPDAKLMEDNLWSWEIYYEGNDEL